MRIVLDTSVLVAALRSEAGAAAEIVRLILLGQIGLLLDYKLVSEYRDVALRSEHLAASRKSKHEVEAVIDALESIAIGVRVGVRYRPLSRDANDDMVLDVAIHGLTDALVTNNVKHFADPAAGFGIRVQTPRSFLADRGKEQRTHADTPKEKRDE